MPPSPLPTTGAATREARRLAGERRWRELAEQLGALPDEALDGEPEAAFHLADALWRLGEPARALRLARGVEEGLGSRGNRWLLLNALNVIGICHFEMGQLEAAESRFRTLLERSTDWGEAEFAARACNNLGVLANVAARRELALTYYQRALAAYQRLGNQRGLAQTHHNIGLSYRDLGFAPEADQHYTRAIALAERSASEDVVARAELERAVLRARGGDAPLATSLATRARARFRHLGDPAGDADATRVLAAAARAAGDDDAAASLLEEALSLAERHPDPLLRAEVQQDRGLLLRDRGDAAGARAALADSLACYQRLGADADADRLRALLAAL